MSFVENIRLPEKHIKSMLKGKPVTIKPDDVKNGVVNSQMYFGAKKDLARLRRNLAKGKATRLNGNHVNEVMVEETEGSGIYSPLRNYEVSGGKLTLKSFGKSVSNAFKKTGKVLNKHVTPILSATAKQMAPVVGEIVGEATKAGVTYATGSPALGRIAGKVTNKLSSNAYKKEVAPRIPKGGNVLSFEERKERLLNLLRSTTTQNLTWTFDGARRNQPENVQLLDELYALMYYVDKAEHNELVVTEDNYDEINRLIQKYKQKFKHFNFRGPRNNASDAGQVGFDPPLPELRTRIWPLPRDREEYMRRIAQPQRVRPQGGAIKPLTAPMEQMSNISMAGARTHYNNAMTKGRGLKIEPQKASTSLSTAVETQPSTFVGARLKSFSAPMENVAQSVKTSPQLIQNTKKQFVSPAERMAYVRSFRNKKNDVAQGGSFIVI